MFGAWWRTKKGLWVWWGNRFLHDFKSVITYFKFAWQCKIPRLGLWPYGEGRPQQREWVCLRKRERLCECVCDSNCVTSLHFFCLFLLIMWFALSYMPMQRSAYMCQLMGPYGLYRCSMCCMAAVLGPQSVGFICISNMPVETCNYSVPEKALRVQSHLGGINEEYMRWLSRRW